MSSLYVSEDVCIFVFVYLFEDLLHWTHGKLEDTILALKKETENSLCSWQRFLPDLQATAPRLICCCGQIWLWPQHRTLCSAEPKQGSRWGLDISTRRVSLLRASSGQAALPEPLWKKKVNSCKKLQSINVNALWMLVKFVAWTDQDRTFGVCTSHRYDALEASTIYVLLAFTTLLLPVIFGPESWPKTLICFALLSISLVKRWCLFDRAIRWHRLQLVVCFICSSLFCAAAILFALCRPVLIHPSSRVQDSKQHSRCSRLGSGMI